MDNKSLERAIRVMLEREIESGKGTLRLFSAFIEETVLKGKSISKIANSTYLVALSELAKSYASFDSTSAINQLDNFFALVTTVSRVQSGMLMEGIIDKEYNYTYGQTIIENSKPMNNYPGAVEDHNQQLLSLNQQHEIDLASCKKQIYPESLLKSKREAPFVAKDGAEYPTILDYVAYVTKLQEEMEKTSSGPKK